MIRSYRNYSNHPISQTPPSSRKTVVVQAFKHPRLKLLFHYPNTFTLRSLDQGRRRCLLAFNSFCGATARVTEYLLAYYRCFRTFTRLLQSFSEYPLNSYCNWGAQTRVAKCFNSLCRARTGVASSPGSLLKNGRRREPGNIREKSCRLLARHHSCDQRRTLLLE